MNSFLSKMSRLDSIGEVILLALHGDVLFRRQAGMSVTGGREVALWNDIINNLGRPPTAEFVFSKGRYYLHFTDIGYIIVGMTDERSRTKIRLACENVQAKLVSRTVRKRILLKMLFEAEAKIKPNFVNALVPFADSEVGYALLPVFQQAETFEQEAKENLQLALCRVFARCSIYAAMSALKKIHKSYADNTSKAGREIKTVAHLAIRQLESTRLVKTTGAGGASTKARSMGNKHLSQDTHLANTSKRASPEELQVKEFLSNDQKRQAVASIMQLITSHAKAGRFAKAEQLRDWLIQIDALALMEIIRAAEIIEEEKSAAISDEYWQIWKELSSALSRGEFASLYHVMTQKNYTDGEIVVQQGAFLPALFFVNSGRVEEYVVSHGREIPLKVVGSGEILGSDTFFDSSVWTVNVVSKGALLSMLTQQRLGEMQDNFPALHTKLRDFCGRFPPCTNHFSKGGRSRRRTERRKVIGRVTIALLSEDGNDTGMGGKGELLDISQGGVALSLRFAQKKNTSALLGKKVRVNLRPDASTRDLLRIGKVMAVRCRDFIGNDYSLHINLRPH